MNLKRIEFTCPFCSRDRVTFVTMDKLHEVQTRDKLMQEIFPPQFFDATYREIFISQICSECQGKTFGSPKSKDGYFDVDVDENTSELEGRISEMYENASRE